MLEQPSIFEAILIGILVLGLLLLWRKGIRQIFEESRQAEQDWGSLLLPIGAVILFVVILILAVAQ
jgi:uncharacterized membrane protein